MKIFILSVLIILPFISGAQSKTSFEITGSIAYSFRDINENKTVERFKTYISRKNTEKAAVRGLLGINISQRIANNFYIRSGLRLVDAGYIFPDDIRLKWGTQGVDGQFIANIPSGEEGYSTSLNHLFLEVPLLFRYHMLTGKGKFQPFVEAGISGMYYLTSFNFIENKGESDFLRERNKDINEFQMVGILSVGLNYDLSERKQLFFQPTFRYHLNPFYDLPIREHLFSAGLEIGCRWSI